MPGDRFSQRRQQLGGLAYPFRQGGAINVYASLPGRRMQALAERGTGEDPTLSIERKVIGEWSIRLPAGG
jgi:hypothetical protein